MKEGNRKTESIECTTRKGEYTFFPANIEVAYIFLENARSRLHPSRKCMKSLAHPEIVLERELKIKPYTDHHALLYGLSANFLGTKFDSSWFGTRQTDICEWEGSEWERNKKEWNRKEGNENEVNGKEGNRKKLKTLKVQ